MRNFPFPLSAISCIPIVLIVGCSESNTPSTEAIKESLKKDIPAYSEITSFQIEKSENLGTETEPKIQTRFKANVRINSDLYNKVRLREYSDKNWLMEAKFIKKQTSKGSSVDLFGLSVSEQLADSWKTDFKLETNPFRELGSPRHEFNAEAIVIGSREEKEYREKIDKLAKERKSEVLNYLLSREQNGRFEPNFKIFGSYSSRASNQPFKIKFTSYNQELNEIAGTMTFGQVIKRFEGQTSDTKITFTTTDFIKGKDEFGLGTEYRLSTKNYSSNSGSFRGSWKHTDNSTGTISIQLN